MNARRRASWCAYVTLALLFLPGAGAAQSTSVASSRGELFLIFPFEQSTREARYTWLSEGLAELFYARLADEDRLVFPRGEWMSTLEKLGLPPSTRFTRATMLKVAEEMDADYVVFGQFATDGKKLSVTTRVLKVAPAALSRPVTESGNLEELMDVQARAAWHVVRFTDSLFPLNQSEYARKMPRRRLDAFEQYIRGLGASEEQRLRNLREAARLEPDWADPAFALGQTYYAAKNCEPALIWLSRVPPGHPRGIEAGFYAGVCHLWRNDLARAESAFAGALYALTRVNARAAGPAEIHNNLAITLSRRGQTQPAAESWERAQRIDESEADYWFNAGVGYFRAQQYAAAVRALRELLKRSPEDGDGRTLLIAALEKLGRATEAAAVREECSKENCGASPSMAAALREPLDTMGAPGPDRLSKVERLSTALDAGALLFSYRAAQEAESPAARPREAPAPRRPR